MKKIIFTCVAAFMAILSNAQDNNGRWYSAGEIQSKSQVQYGRFSFRMYSSDMSGTTSTFFLWKEGSTEPNIQWNEIDVETFGKSANSWQSNPIWEYETNDYNPRRWEGIHTSIPIANTWVTFTVEWTPNYIAWYNNGVQVRRILKGQNAPQGNDPVGNIADAMRMCFNHWATYPGTWLGSFNPAQLPSFQFVDWFTYQKWNGNGFDAVSTRHDFNSLAEVTTNYNISTHTFPDNQCTFRAANIGVINGMLWLSITGYNNARPPAGSEIPNPAGAVNTAPSVSLTSPAANANYTSGTAIPLAATASDVAPGTVTSVAFYDGATLLGTDASSPYTFSWSGASVGTHSITARATDNNGAVTTSAARSVNVTGVVVANPLTSSYFHFVNKWTADYMRPTGGSLTATITQYEEAAGTTPALSSYEWEFRTVTGTSYLYIINRYTQKAIQPTGGSTADNVGLSQTTLTATNQTLPELHWVVEASNEAPYYWIKNRKSNLYIRPNAGANGTGVAIVQNTLNTTLSSFKWALNNRGTKPVAASMANASAAAPVEIVTEENSNMAGIYPNPAKGLLRINTEAGQSTNLRVAIYNVSGGMVLLKEYKNRTGWFTEQIDISKLTAGSYIVKITQGDITTTKKIVKE
jgi:Glycosyl hydrolases family 16/Secretion system C-terminal sorting domain/Bacterial Ig domain